MIHCKFTIMVLNVKNFQMKTNAILRGICGLITKAWPWMNQKSMSEDDNASKLLGSFWIQKQVTEKYISCMALPRLKIPCVSLKMSYAILRYWVNQILMKPVLGYFLFSNFQRHLKKSFLITAPFTYIVHVDITLPWYQR